MTQASDNLSASSASAGAARPADPPRELTPRVRRRSWIEPRVRIWWMGALVLLGITACLVGPRLAGSWRDRLLIREGLRVEAEIVEAAGNPLKNKLHGPDENISFKMIFKLPNGQSREIYERLKAQKLALAVGMTIPLFVNPTKPEEWTDRMEISWAEDSLVAIILLPLAIAFVLVALFLRARVLRVWKFGEVIEAVVLETRHAAAAPLSRHVRFVVRGALDRRVFMVTLPTRIANLQPGDTFWIIAPADQPQRALAAGLYE